jgi:hypothetical protein
MPAAIRVISVIRTVNYPELIWGFTQCQRLSGLSSLLSALIDSVPAAIRTVELTKHPYQRSTSVPAAIRAVKLIKHPYRLGDSSYQGCQAY